MYTNGPQNVRKKDRMNTLFQMRDFPQLTYNSERGAIYQIRERREGYNENNGRISSSTAVNNKREIRIDNNRNNTRIWEDHNACLLSLNGTSIHASFN